jgi:hypothetical protein
MDTAVGIHRADHDILYLQKVGINFADKRRLLSRYSSLVDWSNGVLFFCVLSLVFIPLNKEFWKASAAVDFYW